MFCCDLLSGVALTHTYEKAFSAANGMRRNVPKIVVTVTDGRSQDEVKKGAEQLQHAGKSGLTASHSSRFCCRNPQCPYSPNL